MAKIHRISAPENDSETKAIKALAEVLPPGYMIFHNFELTTGRGLPYEYDIAVVGTSRWTRSARTSRSSRMSSGSRLPA